MLTDDTDFTDVQAFQRFVDMFGRNPSLQRILKHNFGFEYSPELQIPDDPGDENWRGLRGPFHEPLRRIVVTPDNIEGLRGSLGSLYQPPLHIYTSSRDPSRLTSVEAKENDTDSKAKLLQKSTKSERKKKKKLKQKERKRQEKLEMEKQQTGNKEEETDKAQPGGEDAREPGRQEEGATNGKPAAAESSGSSEEEEEEEESSDGEEDATYDSCASEELDMTSSFVSKAAQIARRKVSQKPRAARAEKKAAAAADRAEHKTSPKKPPEGQEADKEDPATPPNSSLKDYVKISNDLAVFGNKCASKGDFKSAVSYFTQAIKCNPTEYKLFGNRSFCFEKLQEYEKALADAELSLGICPGWVKGLFRKGRALAGLKRYDEATQAFGEVLSTDASCAEAAHELMRVQITQLMEFGFTREQSSNALILHGTVKKALEVLSNLNYGTGAVQSCPLPPLRVANVSGVSPVLSANSSLASPVHTPSPPPPPPSLGAAAASARAQDAPKKPPHKAASAAASNSSSGRSQPPELFPIWVGNLNPTISESMITNLFNKAGTVHSAKILSYKRCAFVNYTKQESCDEAIRRFNGHPLNGVTLAVRYPDRIPPGLNISRSAHVAHHH